LSIDSSKSFVLPACALAGLLASANLHL